MGRYENEKLVLKLCIQFMHENDCIQKYIDEYKNPKNHTIYYSGNLMKDLKNSIREAVYDGSPFHYTTKGWCWYDAKHGENYWRTINDKFKDYLKINYKKYENVQF